MLTPFWADARFALRQLRRSPGFAFSAVITLALGIGTTTAIFSLVDGILLRPLPFSNADRLVAVETLEFPPGVPATNLAAAENIGTSYPDFFDWQRENHTFEAIASYHDMTRLFSRNDGVGARVLEGGRVSANFFPTIGVAPALGRNFTAGEEQPGQRVAILSHELWVSDFSSSPAVIGQIVKISDEPYTVVGVMPAGFHYPIRNPGSYWSTFSIETEPDFNLAHRRDSNDLNIVGLLKPGVSMNQALAELNTIQRNISQQYSEDRLRSAVAVMPLLHQAVSDASTPLWFLFISVGVLLLIGCANVAGLLLARANRRRPELALRTALGASRGRVIRQLLVESLLLATGGGITGILLAFVLSRVVPHFIPEDLPRFYNAHLDWRVLTFAVALSAITAIAFGLLPAWIMSRQDPSQSLRESGLQMTSGRRRNRLHQFLVIGQTALGFTLLIGSGLLIRSLVNVLHIEPGFDTHNRVFFDIALTNKRYPVPGKAVFYDKMLPELAALPGVESVGAAHPLPILQDGETTNFTIAKRPVVPDDMPAAMATIATPGYFETLSIPLVRGRLFTARDNVADSLRVAIINQAFAREFFPGEDPIGQYITPTFPYTNEPIAPRQIIGVVGNTRVNDFFQPYRSQFFLPYAQDPSHQRPLVVMKVSGDPLSYESAVRKLVARFDPDSPVFSFRTFIEETQIKAAQQRFEAFLVSGFSVIALLLSALGLYAVLSYVVGERLRELSLRMAFGASRHDILRLVFERAAILAGLGIAAGALASIFSTRLIADLLINVAPLDRTVFLTVSAVLLLVSCIAALAPALRAASVDPARSLRDQ